MTLLDELGVGLPVIAAPMAGGPTTPALVLAAAGAGALGLLAGGYKTPDQLAEQITAVEAGTARFGVNLFVPNRVPVDATQYARYRERIRPDAVRLGAELPASPREDDDQWAGKLDLLVEHPVPLVSFTFGIPGAAALAALRRAGSVLVQTVTSAAEAQRAAEAGVDALAVQGSAAGGHSGTLTPSVELVARSLPELVGQVRAVVDLPILAAGGVADASSVRAAIQAGAAAVAVGTLLLLAPEAGTSAAHRAALLGADRGDTLITRAFTGRPARAIPNRFTAAHHDEAPAGYPALHHLTSPLRRAAAAADDPEYVNLWAGTGYRSVREQPAAQTIAELSAGL